MPQARVVGLGKVGATGMSWYKTGYLYSHTVILVCTCTYTC